MNRVGVGVAALVLGAAALAACGAVLADDRPKGRKKMEPNRRSRELPARP